MIGGVLRASVILFAVFFISIGARASEDREWIHRGFQPADQKYKYFVGVSAPFSSVQDAIMDARNNAAILLVQQEFSTNSDISIKTAETANAIAISNHTTIQLKDVNLSNFELQDQEIVQVDGDVQKYIVKALYKYDQKKLDDERNRLVLLNQNNSRLALNDTQLNSELKKAEGAKKKREEETEKEIKVWRDIFPRLGLDLHFDYGSSKRVMVFGFGLGLRLKILDRIYLGVGGYYGVGSSRKADSGSTSTQSTSSGNSTSGTSAASTSGTTTTTPVSDSDENAGVQADIRLYLVRNPRAGFYVKGLAGYDYEHLTCTKNSAGVCVSQQTPNAIGYSVGGGLGFQLGDQHFYWIETTGAYESNPKIGYLLGLRVGFTWGLIK